MRFTSLVHASGLIALAYAVACSGHDNATGPLIGLSQSEVASLADEASALMPSPNLSGSGSTSASADCPGGGSISANGTYSATATTGTLDLTYTFDACKGTLYTVSGPLRIQGTATGTATALSMQASFKGTLAVSTTDGRSGNCIVDFTVATTITQGTVTPTYTVSGSACGVNVSGTR